MKAIPKPITGKNLTIDSGEAGDSKIKNFPKNL
jgi:hypothetical protein